MRSIFRFTLSSVTLLTVIFIPLVSAAVGIFSQKWGLPIPIVPITSIASHALDVVGQIVYFGSSVTTGFTNYLYACNISNGNLVWRYNTSIPVNYVSHFNNGSEDFVVVGTGGSTTRIGKSYVYSFNLLKNVTQWNSPNLNSSVTTVEASQSYVTTGEDIVAGLDNGTVIRLRGDNGAVLWSYSCLGSVLSVTELRNGSVVVGTREIPNKGYVYCLNSDGSLRWGPISKQNNILTLVRKFADVNGDGEPEIVAVFNDGLIHVYDGKTGAEVSPWPFEIDNSGDNVKDLLCTEDYTGDGFPDLIFGTDYGNLTIVNGLTAQPFLGPVSVGATVSYIQYMYSYQSGFVYSNKTLAVSLLDNDYVSYYIRGYNTTDLTPMKQYSIASRGQNLFNVANYTVDFTGDLIFTVNNVVYCISGDELVVPDLSTQSILAVLIVLALFLVINLRPRRLKPNPKSKCP